MMSSPSERLARARFFASPIRLIDGPVVDTRRTELVMRMAKDLVDNDAMGSERDAIRLLAFKGYRASCILMLVEDARQVAVQSVVAREMSAP